VGKITGLSKPKIFPYRKQGKGKGRKERKELRSRKKEFSR